MRRSFIPTTRSGKVIAVLFLWYVVVLLAWGVQPMTDNVPVKCLAAADPPRMVEETRNCHIDHLGVFDEEKRVERASQSVSCHSPLSNDRSVRGDGLPQPAPGWVYEREACKIPVRSATQLLGLNTVVVLLGCAAAFAWQRSRRHVLPALVADA